MIIFFKKEKTILPCYAAICELVKLQSLDLSDNSIEDVVPSCCSKMPSLRTLKLSKNRFQRNLTSILSNLSTIEYITFLAHLSIFANLSNLSYLDLSYNYHLEVETETQLQHLLLAGCNLNRRSGHMIPCFLSTLHNLITLDLSNDLLVRNFPSWMLLNVSAVLSLRGNSFVGQFPRGLENISTLTLLDISDKTIISMVVCLRRLI